MKSESKFTKITLLGICYLVHAWLSPCTLTAQVKRHEVPVNPDAYIIQDFETRIAEYVKLHRSIEGTLPTLTPTDAPEKILQHQKELARMIREARQKTSQGDIFSPQIKDEFRRLIAITMRGKQAARIKESLNHSEPVQFPLRINAAYPAGVPLQTTPPTLLQNLPSLPPEMEYRVVGHQLILRDVNANLIVDFMAEVIP
jgi:hypothetical protein